MTILGRKNTLLPGIDISSTSVKLLEIVGSKGVRTPRSVLELEVTPI